MVPRRPPLDSDPEPPTATTAVGPTTTMPLAGRVAAVTGSASGIGKAIATVLAEAGATVAILDRNRAGAEETVAALRATGRAAYPFYVDLADEVTIPAAVEAVTDALGPVSVLVNNAGWDIIQAFIENDYSYIRRVIAVNYLGPVLFTQAVVRGMIEAGEGGRVVNISSDAGRVGSTGEAVYAGAKAGIIGFTKSLARELARDRITVNCVCPGPTDTPLFRAQPQHMQESLLRAIPFRRLAQPADIAAAVDYFVSDRAGFVTGQVLSVSGGLTMAG